MKFNQYIQYRALSRKAQIEGSSSNSAALDALMENELKHGAPNVKTVCAPITMELFERMNETLGMLDISKRTFIEAAIIEALDKADVIMAEVDIFENQYPPAEAQAQMDQRKQVA